MQRNIKVLVVEPNKLPYEKTIKNTLQTKQDLVGGLIEYTYMLDDDSVALVCNEEGKLMGLELNRDIGYDVIAGPFFIVGYDDSGEDRSLTDGQLEKYKNRFGKESIEKTKEIVSKIILERNLEM